MAKDPKAYKHKLGEIPPEHFDGEPIDLNPAERMSEEDLGEFEKLVDGLGGGQKEDKKPDDQR